MAEGVSGTSSDRLPSVTLIVPMRNEVDRVEGFIDDVAAQDYRGPVDLIVADGASSDGSGERLAAAAASAGVLLTLLENPERFVSHGLNQCIGASTGELLIRLDCHSRYPPDYVRLCAEVSEATAAWNVGGLLVPQGSTPTERAVAAAMDGPFGGIGWTRAAAAAGPVETDTVTFGAFRREAFAAAGLFDESLVRNQDDELNLRLRLAGGRVMLDPRIRVFYVPRGSLSGVFRQYYEYGRWKIPVMRKHSRALGMRSLVPAAFVVSILVLGALAPWVSVVGWALVVELVLYLAGASWFGVRSLRRRGESLTLLPRVIGAYLAFHIGYGVGMLRGLLG